MDVLVGEKRKKRGHYKNHLSEPSLKVPKSTYYRIRQQRLASHLEPVAEEALDEAPDAIEESDVDDISSDDEIHHAEFEDAVDVSELIEEREVEPVDFVSSDDEVHNAELEEAVDVSELIEEQEVEPVDFVSSDDEVHYAELEEAVDEESESESVEKQSTPERVPLFEGAQINLAVSMLLVITYAVRHSLTGVALADLLLLIEVHLVSPNNFGRSMALLRSFFKKLKNPLEYHYYCSFCYEYVGTAKECGHCPNCLKDFIEKGTTLGYFIIIPLVNQLQDLLASKCTDTHAIFIVQCRAQQKSK